LEAVMHRTDNPKTASVIVYLTQQMADGFCIDHRDRDQWRAAVEPTCCGDA
jgi:hypothetical protein